MQDGNIDFHLKFLVVVRIRVELEVNSQLFKLLESPSVTLGFVYTIHCNRRGV